MSSPEILKDLLERVRKAEGASLLLDRAVYDWLGEVGDSCRGRWRGSLPALKHGAEAREHGLEAAAASAAAWLGGLQRPGPVGRAGDAVTVLKVGRGGFEEEGLT